MRPRTFFFAAIALLSATSVQAATSDEFDRVFTSVYTDLLFDAKTAYQGKRYDQAFPLIQKAACTGDKESQWILGVMYLMGQGVQRDDLQGYAWIKSAAEFDSANYRSTARKIENALDEQQRQVAKAAADGVIGAYGLRATRISCSKAASQRGHIMDLISCTPQIDGNAFLIKRCLGTPAPR
jgi:TPR repeat protein